MYRRPACRDSRKCRLGFQFCFRSRCRRPCAHTLLNESIRVDPRNFVVRYKYLASLQTRWGGSLEQMLDFEKQARAAGLSDVQLRYFASMIVAARWFEPLAGVDRRLSGK